MITAPDSSLFELFREEARTHAETLTRQLLQIEGGDAESPDGPTNAGKGDTRLAVLMRAAHSIKGAARIVGFDSVLRLAHAMEDRFVAAQGGVALTSASVDSLLSAVDVLVDSARVALDGVAEWEVAHVASVDALIERIQKPGDSPPADARPARREREKDSAAEAVVAVEAHPRPQRGGAWADRLLGLAGEALVASRALQAHSTTSLHHRRAQNQLSEAIEQLAKVLSNGSMDPAVRRALVNVQQTASARQALRRHHDSELEAIQQQISDVATRMYDEVLDMRMRPFQDGTSAFPRMVRDLGRDLGKNAHLIVQGESTPVDREVLRRLESPLGHLLRNAVDHGLESPADRRSAGKPERGTITLSARHGGGRLLVTVEDDGRGVDIESLRRIVVEQGHAPQSAAAVLTEKELLDFLFLPGFTLRDEVTSLSGRGVGLDAVRTALHEIGGDVRVSSDSGKGTRFELRLPLTLSVVRALIADVAGQPYAIPLSRVRRVVQLQETAIHSAEGRQHFSLDDRQVGLLWAHQVLGLGGAVSDTACAAVIVLDDHDVSYGLAVDGLLGEREIVLQGLDPLLGKVPNVGAAAILPDGAPVLVLDVDDLVRSVANLLQGSRPDSPMQATVKGASQRKRVLVVEDSLTVRELERKLIAGRGYHVDLAVDGMDGWNAVRTGTYDLVVTDVDMPRLDGIELISLIRKDHSLRSMPIMIVSYKDREEDRRRGLEAGADHYVTKASFYDETMLRLIEDLIGEPVQ